MMLNYLRIAFLILAGAAFSLGAQSQVTIAQQNFDGGTPGWSYTSDIPFFDNGWGTDGYYGVIDLATATQFDFPSLSGNVLGVNDLDDEGDNGSGGFVNLSFANIDISGNTNVAISFDYDIQGFNANDDDAQYEVYIDGISQGVVILHDGDGVSEDSEGSINVNIPDGSNTVSLVVSFRSNGLDDYAAFDNFLLQGDPPSTQVFVNNQNFAVTEADGSYNIPISISNPSGASATDATITLQSGNAALVDGFTSGTVTFPAGSSADAFLTITTVDNSNCTGPQELTFEITSASGGNNAQVGSPSIFTVTFVDDEAETNNPVNEKFEDGDFIGWTNTDAWIVDGSNPISGSFSMRHDPGEFNSGYIWTNYNLNGLDLAGATTTWEINIDADFTVPGTSDQNWVYYMLAGSTNNILGTANGYAVGVNFDSNADPNDSLRLVRVDGGIVSGTTTALITSDFTFDPVNIVGIRVTRDGTGTWELFYKEGGGFTSMTSAGTAVDETYTSSEYLSVGGRVSLTNIGVIQFDDVRVDQFACSQLYYTVQSGNSDEAIWSTDQNGTTGQSIDYSQFIRLNIQPGHTVTMVDNITVDDFTIQNGGAINQGSNNLFVHGAFIISGTFNAETGTVIFKGSSGQTILTPNGPVVLNNLNLENDGFTTTIAPGSELLVTGTIKPISGNLDTGSNPARLTLMSNASGTASILEFGPTASILGSIKAQRYLPAAQDGWVNLGSILDNVTLADWDEELVTTGYPDSDYPDFDFDNIYTYDESVTGELDQGFNAVSSNSETVPFDVGYLVYMDAASNIVEVEGDIFKGPLNSEVSYTSNTSTTADGWNLVSNPYPSTIDFEMLAQASENISTYYVYDSDTDQYLTYVAGSGGDAGQYIPMGQSFWVKADNFSAELRFRENQKTSVNAEFVRNDVIIAPYIDLSLVNENETLSDKTRISLRDESSFNYDSQKDALYLSSFDQQVPHLSTMTQDGFNVTMNAVPTTEGNIEVPVHLDIAVVGTYNLSVSDLYNFPASSCLSIEDLETGEMIALEEGQTLTETFAEPFEGVRYIIHISAPLTGSKTDVSCNGLANGSAVVEGNGDGPWSYTWYDEMGNVITEETESTEPSELTDLAFGTYFVEVTDPNLICGTVTKSFEINEPMVEELELETSISECNLPNGSVTVNIEEASAYSYTLINQGTNQQFTAEEIEGEVTIGNLAGNIYDLTTVSDCNTFTSVVDLRDVNTVTAAIEVESTTVELVDGIAEVTFENDSENATTYFWNFGNGDTSEIESPMHTYTEVGEYEVSLYAQNDFCNDQTTKTITVDEGTGIEDAGYENEIAMTTLQNQVQLTFGDVRFGQSVVEVYNAMGQRVISKKLSNVNGDVILIETAKLSAGVYSLSVIADENRVFTQKFVR